jgi:hypothetical protein
VIVHALSGIDKFADLEGGRPHCSLTASDRRVSITVIEHLMGDQRAPQTKQADLNAPEVQTSRSRFVQDMEVFYVVGSSPKLFHDSYVLACTPDSVYGNLKL